MRPFKVLDMEINNNWLLLKCMKTFKNYIYKCPMDKPILCHYRMGEVIYF